MKKGRKILSLLLVLTTIVSMCFTMELGAWAGEAELSASAAWTGGIDTSWYSASGTSFEISTAEALAGLAAIVNGTAGDIDEDTFEGKTVTLTDDIDLGGINNSGTWSGTSWTPIGNATFTYNAADTATYVTQTGYAFLGTFDGAGHTISNIYIASANGYLGLFGCVGSTENDGCGTVKNFNINGYVSNTSTAAGGTDFAGAVCGKLNAGGKIEDVINSAQVYCPNTYNVGGIVGFAGTPVKLGSKESTNMYSANPSGANTSVLRCGNSAYILGYNKTGGIVGENAAIVKYCYNTGTLQNNLSGSGGGLGGIAGRNGNNNTAAEEGTIMYCYNSGTIKGTNPAGTTIKWSGGITGWTNLKGIVQKNLSLGTVEQGFKENQAICGRGDSPFTGLSDNYALDSIYDCCTETKDAPKMGIKMTSDQLKATTTNDGDILKLLEPYFAADGNTDSTGTTYINNGYPILWWQKVEESDTTTLITSSMLTDSKYTIKKGGNYKVDTALTGAIFVETGDPVTIEGNVEDMNSFSQESLAATGHQGLSIVGSCAAGNDITIKNMFIKAGNEAGSYYCEANKNNCYSPIRFTSENVENKLHFAGINCLESEAGGAVIHVGPTQQVVIDGGSDGSGTLYAYKKGAWSAVGGNGSEVNGKITFNNGSFFFKGSAMGAIIGSGSYCLGTPGDITINGGTFNLIANARGALIGLGAGDVNNQYASDSGQVYINGGCINMNVDWTGAAIGASGKGSGPNEGNVQKGQVTITGGSLRTYVDTNSYSKWGQTSAGVTSKAITAAIKSDQNENLYLLTVPTDGTDGNHKVVIDGKDYYEGGLHQYRYVNENTEKDGQTTISDTTTNWAANKEPNLYFYLTGDTHTISVDGGEAYTVEFDSAAGTFSEASGEESHTHSMTAYEAVLATCTTAGNSAYWYCNGCEKYFSDAEGTTEIEADSWIVEATGHSFGGWNKTDTAYTRTCTNSGCTEKESFAADFKGAEGEALADMTFLDDKLVFTIPKLGSDEIVYANGAVLTQANGVYSISYADLKASGVSTRKIGDADGNGEINSDDAGMMLLAISNAIKLDGANGAAASAVSGENYSMRALRVLDWMAGRADTLA